MDRRFHERHAASFRGTVVPLAEKDQSVSGPVVDISKTGICLILPLQLASGDIVRIKIDDSQLFGHIAYATPEGSLFRTGIEVQRVLLGGTDLSHVLKRVLLATMPATPGVHGSEAFLG